MAGETVVTICGNLTADPELRFTPSGVAVAKFTVASTPRTFNRNSNAWEDGETLFLNCSVWRQAAEHVAESLTRGTRVIVQGRLKQRSYEKDGQKHTVFDLDVEEVGPSLRNATAKVAKAAKSGGGQSQGFGQRSSRQQGGAPADDPWASSAPAQQGAGGWGQGGGFDQDPPF